MKTMDKIKKLFKNPIVSLIVTLLITLLVIYFVFKDNYLEIFALIQSIKPIWFIVFLFIVLGYHFLIGLNLKVLVNDQGIKYGCFSGFINALIASFGHDITPSSSGGQVLQMIVFRKQKIDYATGASVLWADFIIYQSMMILTCFLLIVSRIGYFNSHFKSLIPFIVLGFIINASVIFILMIGVKNHRVFNRIVDFIIKVLHKLHLLKDSDKLRNNLNIQVEKFKNCASEFYHHPKVLLKCCTLQILRLLMYYSLPFIVSLSMGIQTLNGSGWLMTLLNCICLSSYISMINSFVPLPGASGGSEAFFVIMFGSIYGSVNASAMMALWRFYTYYLIMFIGAITFFAFKYIYHGPKGE